MALPLKLSGQVNKISVFTPDDQVAEPGKALRSYHTAYVDYMGGQAKLSLTPEQAASVEENGIYDFECALTLTGKEYKAKALVVRPRKSA